MLNNKLFLSLSLLTFSNLALGMDLSPNPKSFGANFESLLINFDDRKLAPNQKAFWTSLARAYMGNRSFPGIAFILADRTHDNLLLHNCLLYCDVDFALELYHFMKKCAEKLNKLEEFKSYIKLQNSDGLNALHYAVSRADITKNLITEILNDVRELVVSETINGKTAYNIYLEHGIENCNADVLVLLNYNMIESAENQDVMQPLDAASTVTSTPGDAAGFCSVM